MGRSGCQSNSRMDRADQGRPEEIGPSEAQAGERPKWKVQETAKEAKSQDLMTEQKTSPKIPSRLAEDAGLAAREKWEKRG